MKKRLKNCLVYTIDGAKNINYLAMVNDKDIFHPAFTLTDMKTDKVRVMYWQVYYTSIFLEVVVDKDFTDIIGVKDKKVTEIIRDYNSEAQSVYDGINCLSYADVFEKMWDELREYTYDKVIEHLKSLSKELDKLPYAQKKVSDSSTLIKFGNMMGLLVRIPAECIKTALLFIDRHGNLCRDNIESINAQHENEFNSFLRSIEYPMLITTDNWKTLPVRKI